MALALMDLDKSVTSGQLQPRDRLTRKEEMAAQIEAAFALVTSSDLAGLAGIVKTKKQANWHRPKQIFGLLDQAVRVRSLAVVEWLMTMGADPNTLFFGDGRIPLRHATKPGMYFSPFAYAITDKQDAIVLAMLDRGASLEMPLWIEDDEVLTCREHAVKNGLWPTIEAHLLRQSTRSPAPADRASPKRL